MHAKLLSQSLLMTHCGRQLGAVPIMLSRQPHWALLPTAWHTELGPHGEGLQGSVIWG